MYCMHVCVCVWKGFVLSTKLGNHQASAVKKKVRMSDERGNCTFRVRRDGRKALKVSFQGKENKSRVCL